MVKTLVETPPNPGWVDHKGGGLASKGQVSQPKTGLPASTQIPFQPGKLESTLSTNVPLLAQLPGTGGNDRVNSWQFGTLKSEAEVWNSIHFFAKERRSRITFFNEKGHPLEDFLLPLRAGRRVAAVPEPRRRGVGTPTTRSCSFTPCVYFQHDRNQKEESY